MIKKIFLIGYMGSGKTSIGAKLAEILNCKFLDLDAFIEEREEMSVKMLFKLKGEIYFRKAETKYLQEIIDQNEPIIVSLGGGTPCYGNNMERVLSATDIKSVYLKATIPTLAERLFTEKEQRPLIAHLNSKELLIEFIGKHLFERSPFYSQSEVTILTDGKSIDEIVEEVLKAED
ncbi:shikimate kinase [Mangrovimonas xylaniphaga]|uniref:shikimate kinase n=1 Tax=Mangrovimonas xylaniphaga TaxID=1645915 RepID=UPI0006B68AC5|nr:shikimate kinase [Mangrovimonas xylaniphaga]